VQAIALDCFGNTVAAAERICTIDNYRNSMNLARPPLPPTLHGTVKRSLSGGDSRYFPAQWIGELLDVAWTDNMGQHNAGASISVDTTRFANGRHELYVAMHSGYWQPGHQEQNSYYNYRGAFERVSRTATF
jgi:hypothetical protein